MKELDSKLDELEKDIEYLEKITGIIKSRERIASTYFGIKLRTPNIDEIVQDKSIKVEDLELLQTKIYHISKKLVYCANDLDRVISSIKYNVAVIDKIFEAMYDEETIIQKDKDKSE